MKGLQKSSKKKQKLYDKFFKPETNKNEKKYRPTNLYLKFLKKSLKNIITPESLIVLSKI